MDAKNGASNGADEPTPRATRTRRRPAQAIAKPPKRSLNLRIEPDCYERLTIHAMKRRTTISALIEQLAREHLREYYVARTGRAGEGNGAQEGL